MKRDLAFCLNPCDIDRRSVMKDLAEAGIKLIGVDGTGWNPNNSEGALEIKEFIKDLNEFGLQSYSMHACCHILASGDKDTPPSLLKEQLDEIKQFSMLGGKTAVYHACWMRDVDFRCIDREIEKVGWNSFVERNAKTIKILANEAMKSGISIVLENINCNAHTESFDGFIDIINAVDEPNVGLLLDSGHAHIAGRNVAEEVKRAGKLLMDTHFHDNFGPVNQNLSDDLHIPPGLGTIDWRKVNIALNEINFSGPIVFEGVLGPGDSIENGRFDGKLCHKDLINITINNWRAFELLVANLK